MSNLPSFDVLPKELRDKLLSDGSFHKDLLTGGRDEVPEDIRAFFGHPLTAATTAINGDDTHASALALLHEYQNLPAIDRTDIKIGDKFETFSDILQSENRKDGGSDYMMLINTDIDAFLNRHDEESLEALSKGPLDEESTSQDLESKPGSSPSADLLLSQPKPDTPSSTASQEDFSVFSPAEPLELTTAIKQEESPCATPCDAFLDALGAGPLTMDTPSSLQGAELGGPLPSKTPPAPGTPTANVPAMSQNGLSPIASSANEIVAHLQAPLCNGKQKVSPSAKRPPPLQQAIHPLARQKEQQQHQLQQQHQQHQLQQCHQQIQQQQQHNSSQEHKQQQKLRVDCRPADSHSAEQMLASPGDLRSAFSLQHPHLPTPPPLLHMSHSHPARPSASPESTDQPLALVTTPKTMPALTPGGHHPTQQQQQQQSETQTPIHPPPPYQMHPSAHLPFIQQQQHISNPPDTTARAKSPSSQPPPEGSAYPPSAYARHRPPQQSTSAPSTPCGDKDLFPLVKTESEPSSPKASDSTKKIIQAIHEKLRRNQMQKHASEQDGQMSFCDINDIIKESIENDPSDGGVTEQVGGVSEGAMGGADSDDSPVNGLTPLWTNTAEGPAYDTWTTSPGAQPSPTQSNPVQQPSTPHSSQNFMCFSPELQPNYSNVNFGAATPPAQPKHSPAGPFSARGVGPRPLAPPPSSGQTPAHTPGHTPAASPGPADRNMVLVISPQVSYNAQQPYPAGTQHSSLTSSTSTYTDLKSPDSGFNESCVSPTDTSGVFTDHSSDQSATQEGAALGGKDVKAIKRRRSSSATSSVKQACSGGGCSKSTGTSSTVIEKVDPDLTGYRYILETNTSTSQRIEEDRITYLNKGQFYGLTLEFTPTNRILQCNTVKSIIVVLFRDERAVEDEIQAWEFWHSRQHSVKQRILDIDTKNSVGILSNCIDEIAHNAVAIRWNPREQAAKVSIAINCLSTDFSNQKGVKGLPLHVQIDTYEDAKDVTPVHRGYCQVKVFCDKGAERKTRDEERRKEAKAKNAESMGHKKVEEMYHPVTERSIFYSMADLTKQPILFNPVPEYEDYTQKGLVGCFGNSICPESDESLMSDDLMGSPAKRCRVSSSAEGRESQRVLLYVRETHETVFTALLLHTPSLVGLAHAIEEKYNIPALKIKNTFKRSKKGLLVKMDDNIIRHYSNESTFIISIKKNEETHENQLNYDVTLVEIDPEAV